MLNLRRVDSFQLGIQIISAIKYDPVIEKLVIITNEKMIRVIELDSYQIYLEYSFQFDGQIEKIVFLDSNRVFIVLKLGDTLDGIFYRLNDSLVEKRFPLKGFREVNVIYNKPQNRLFIFERNVGVLNIFVPDSDVPSIADQVFIPLLKDLIPMKQLIVIHCGTYFQIFDPKTNLLIYKSEPNRLNYKIISSDLSGTLLFCIDIENHYRIFDLTNFEKTREPIISDKISEKVDISNMIVLSDGMNRGSLESPNIDLLFISESSIYHFEPYINKIKKMITEKTRIIWGFYERNKGSLYLGLQNGDIQKYDASFQSESIESQNVFRFKPIFSFNFEHIGDLNINSLKISDDFLYLIGIKKSNILCVMELQKGTLLHDFAFEGYLILTFDFLSADTLCLVLIDKTQNLYSNLAKPPKIVTYNFRDNRILTDYSLTSIGSIVQLVPATKYKILISVLPDNILEVYSLSEFRMIGKYHIKEIKDPILFLGALDDKQIVVCSKSAIGIYSLQTKEGLAKNVTFSEPLLSLGIVEQSRQIICVFQNKISIFNEMLREIYKFSINPEFGVPKDFILRDNQLFFSNNKNQIFMADLIWQNIKNIYSTINTLKILTDFSYWVFISEYNKVANRLSIQILSKMDNIKDFQDVASPLLFDPQLEIVTRIETTEPAGSIKDFFFIPNTSLLILLHYQQGPLLWDFIENQIIEKYEEPSCAVEYADMNEISNAIIACGNQENVILNSWNLISKRVLKINLGIKTGATKIRISQSQLYICVSYNDGSLDILNAFNYKLRFSIDNTHKIQDFCFFSDHKHLITADNTGSVKLWNLDLPNQELENNFILLYKSNEHPNVIHIDQTDSILFIGYSSGSIDVIDLNSGSLLKKIEICHSPIQFIDYEEETKDLLFAEFSGFLIRYNIENMDVTPFTQLNSPIIRGKFDKINKLIFILTWDSRITVFNSLMDLSKQVHNPSAKKIIPPIPFSEQASLILALDRLDFSVCDAIIKANSQELMVIDSHNTLWNVNLLTTECFERTLIQNRIQSYKTRSIFQNGILNYYITIPVDPNDPIMYFHESFDACLGKIHIPEVVIKPIAIDNKKWIFLCEKSIIFWSKNEGIKKIVEKNSSFDGFFLPKYRKLVILSRNELEFLSSTGVTEKIIRISPNPIKIIYSEPLDMIILLDRDGILYEIDPINMEIFSSHKIYASCVDFELSNDSNYLALAIGSNILILSMHSFETIKNYRNDSIEIKKIFKSIDGYYLISIDKEGNLRIWNFDINSSTTYLQLIQGKKQEYVLPIYKRIYNQKSFLFESELSVSHPLAIFLSFDQKEIIVVDIAANVYLFDFMTKKFLNIFHTNENFISFCEYLNEFELGMISLVDNTFILFNIKSKKINQFHLPKKLEQIKDFKKSNTQNCFYIADNTSIYKIQYPEMKIIESISIPSRTEIITQFEISDQESIVFILTSLNTIYSFSHSGQRIAEYRTENEEITGILFNPETRTICASTKKGTLCVFHAYTLKMLKIIDGVPKDPLFLKNIPNMDKLLIINKNNHECILISIEREDYESIPLGITGLSHLINLSVSFCLNFILGITSNGKMIVWNLQAISRSKFKRDLSEFKIFAYSYLNIIKHPSLSQFAENTTANAPIIPIQEISEANPYKLIANRRNQRNSQEKIEITNSSLNIADISLIRWIPELEIMAIASDDGTIVCTNVFLKKRLCSFQCEHPIIFMRYSRVINSIIVISGIFSGRLQIFSLGEMRIIFDQKYSKEIYKAFDLSPDHTSLCLVESNRLNIFNIQSQTIIQRVNFSELKLSFEISWIWYLSSNRILLLSNSGEVAIYNLPDKKVVQFSKICTHSIKYATIGDDRSRLVIVMENNSIQLFEIPTFIMLCEFSASIKNISAIAYSDLNNLIVIGTFDGSLLFCSCDTKEIIKEKTKLAKSITHLEFNPYGDFLFCCSSDNIIIGMQVTRKMDPFLPYLRYLKKGLLNFYQSQESIDIQQIKDKTGWEQAKWSNFQRNTLVLLNTTGELQLLNLSTLKSFVILSDCKESCFKQSDSGRYILILRTSKRNRIEIYDLFIKKIIFSYSMVDSSIIDYTFLEKTHLLVLCSSMNKIIEIQIDTNVNNEITLELQLDLIITDEDSSIYFTDRSGSIYKKCDNEIEKIFQNNHKITSLTISKKYNTIIATDETNLIIFIDIYSNQLINAISMNSMKGIQGVMTRDGDFIIIDSFCSFVKLTYFGKQIDEISRTYLGKLKDFSISRDGKYLAIVSDVDFNIFPLKKLHDNTNLNSEFNLTFGLLPIQGDFPKPFFQIKIGDYNQMLFLLSEQKDRLYCYRLKDLSIAHEISFKQPIRIQYLIDCSSERYILFKGFYDNLESHIWLDIITKEMKPLSIELNKRESINKLAQITNNNLLYFLNDNDYLEIYDLTADQSIKTFAIPEIRYFKVKELLDIILILSEDLFEYTIHIISLVDDIHEIIKIDKDIHELIESIDFNTNFDLILRVKDESIIYRASDQKRKKEYCRLKNGYYLEEADASIQFFSIIQNQQAYTKMRVEEYGEKKQNELIIADFGFDEIFLSAFHDFMIIFNTIRADVIAINKDRNIDLIEISNKDSRLENLKKAVRTLKIHFEKQSTKLESKDKELSEQENQQDEGTSEKKSTRKKSTKKSTKKTDESTEDDSTNEKKSTRRRKKSSGLVI